MMLGTVLRSLKICSMNNEHVSNIAYHIKGLCKIKDRVVAYIVNEVHWQQTP